MATYNLIVKPATDYLFLNKTPSGKFPLWSDITEKWSNISVKWSEYQISIYQPTTKPTTIYSQINKPL